MPVSLEDFPQLLAHTDAKRRKKAITQTQVDNDFNIGAELLQAGIAREAVATTYEEKIRVDMFPQGLRRTGIGSGDNPQRGGTAKKLVAGLAMYQNDNEMYDYRALGAERIDELRLVSTMDVQQAQNDEAIARAMEEELLTCADDSDADLPKMSGLWEHARGTHDSGGNIVVTPEPDFVGVYADRTGGADATWQGLSRASIPMLANLAATYNDNTDVIQQVRVLKRMQILSTFNPSSIMRHKEKISGLVQFVPQSFFIDYSELINVRNADKGGTDTEPMNAERIGRCRMVSCAKLDDDPLVPFFGLRMNRFKWLFQPGMWLKRSGPHKIDRSRHQYYMGFDHIANLWCSNARDGCFVYHRETAAA